jgi:DNA-binding transcriptional ArsR family regulator
MGDGPRLRLLEMLSQREWCVSEIVQTMGEKFSTVSQRLRLLRLEGLIVRRREGTHLYYALADRHVADLIHNALAHAAELEGDGAGAIERRLTVANQHANHAHQHGPNCGHTAIQHNGHTDYLHDGHLHHPNGGQIEEHKLDVGSANPASCTPQHQCGQHDAAHKHGPGCGHEAVPHGDHTDYLVAGHLHHPHGNHCDDHGKVQIA